MASNEKLTLSEAVIDYVKHPTLHAMLSTLSFRLNLFPARL